MSEDLTRRSHAILKAAVDLDLSGRNAYIESACAGEPRLRRQVQQLLDALEDTHGFLETPALESERAPSGGFALQPDKIGGYQIERVIGAGGMATVYEAIQERPRRRVALKVMKRYLADSSALQRFEFETEVLARLKHPGIAQIFEAGVHDDGQSGAVPFFAMEYIEGARPITAYADERFLDARARLEMFSAVCDAVQHGHQNGVIHRDLKPGNILVGADGRPKVIDFGVARSSDGEGATSSQYTQHGQLIGTLNYMSPEQCVGGGAIDARSDVYSLGVVLYELLCGAPPHELSAVPIPEALRMVLQETPRRPSGTNSAFRGDVDAIVMKALEKEPARRYQTASEFAADVNRLLEKQPIQARPATTMYQLRKFAQRNRSLVGGIAAVFVTLLIGIGATTRQAYLADRARREADLLRESAESRLTRAIEAETAAEQARDLEQQQRLIAEQRGRELEEVTEFQSAQLRGINVAEMGSRLREDLLAKARVGLSQAGAEPGEVEAAVAEFERALATVNFTDVALATLDASLFERSLKAIEDQFADQPLVEAQLLSTLALTMDDLGLLARSAETMQRAVEIRRQELGNSDLLTLSAIHGLGSVLVTQARYSEAEECYREVLDGRRRVLGEDHPETVRIVNSMGALLVQQGKLAEAEPYFKESLETRRRTLGEDHPDTLRAMSNMGTLLQDQGKYAEAAPYCIDALEKRRRILGDDHPSTLISIDTMGSLLRGEGRLEDAEACYEEALESRRRVLGSTHPQTLRSINNMAAILTVLGKHAEAEPLYHEALDARLELLGPDHPDTLRSMNNMALVLHRQGLLEDAEAYYSRVLAANRRVLGDEHPSTIFSLDRVGTLLQELGRLDEAEAHFREAMLTGRRVLGEGHADVLHATSHLGGALRELGELEEAAAMGREAVERARQAFPEGHWNTATFLAQYAKTLVAMKRFVEAEAALLEAVELNQRVLGEEHESTVRVSQQLVELYNQWKKASPQSYPEDRAEKATRASGGGVVVSGRGAHENEVDHIVAHGAAVHGS